MNTTTPPQKDSFNPKLSLVVFLDLLPDPTSAEMRELCAQEKTAVGSDCFNAGWYQAFAWIQDRLHKSNELKDNQPIPPCAFHTMGDDMTMRPIVHDDTVGKTPSELTEFPENYHFTVPDEVTERFKRNKAKIKPL